ncbi:MAG TPA: hypothetical protein VFD99_05520, partial [Arthrobacter sp.]|nr:hypothetical protein [Arthrobacter sp.]
MSIRTLRPGRESQSLNKDHVAGRGRGRPKERPPGALRWLASAAVGALLAAALAPLAMVPAQAAVAGVSPVDPQTGYPTWYSDGTVKLQLCYMAGAGCLMEPPNPDVPPSHPDNFPAEAFWFQAAAQGGTLMYEAALEAAHVNGPTVAGEQIGFARLRFNMNGLKPGAAYTFRHPYGVNTFTAEPAGSKRPGEIRVTIDEGICTPSRLSPCNWAGVGEAFLGAYQDGT